MNEEEYWFLNLVVEESWPLHVLASANLEMIVNGPGHGLGHSDLIAMITKLLAEGDITAWLFGDREIEFIPAEAQIIRELFHKKRVWPEKEDIFFNLTAKGSERWEAVSQPDWSKFVDLGMAQEQTRAVCRDRALAEEYFRILPCHPLYYAPLPETIKWEIISPWPATYWKTLSSGHQMTYQPNLAPTKREAVLESYGNERESFDRWNKFRKTNRWYVHPFGQ